MYYSTRDKEQLGSYMLEYFFNLEQQFIAKLKGQFTDKITTRTGEYKIKNIEGGKNLEIDSHEIKIHSIFAPDGCKISGRISINVFAESPNSDGNLLSYNDFTINFESVLVKYNFEDEKFEIPGEIRITYITD